MEALKGCDVGRGLKEAREGALRCRIVQGENTPFWNDLYWCHCLEWDEREEVLQRVVEQVVALDVKERLHMVSFGAAGLLQEAALVQELADRGVRHIELHLVDTKFAEHASGEDREFVDRSRAAFQRVVEVLNPEARLHYYSDLGSVALKTMDVFLAIDVNFPHCGTWQLLPLKDLRDDALCLIAKGVHFSAGPPRMFPVSPPVVKEPSEEASSCTTAAIVALLALGALWWRQQVSLSFLGASEH